MPTSIFSGRSHYGRSAGRSSRSTAPGRPRVAKPSGEPREPEEPEKPDLDELRRRRLLYLSVSSETRRKQAATATLKARRKQPSSASTKAVGPEPQRRRRRRKGGSSKVEKSNETGRSRTEDYVYGTTNASSRRDQHDVLKKTTSSSRRHSLPVVSESEVSPGDSVSQVGEQRENEQHQKLTTSRSPLKRSCISSSRLHSVAEQDIEGQSVTTASRRSSKHVPQPSLLGLFRRHTAPAVPVPPRLVECLTCAADDVPITKAAKLSCGHRMCHDCLKRIFEMSVKDPSHMPPKCCTNEHIPLQHVDKIFDLRFKMLWNRKYQEYHTKNRMYCPAPKCGEWIKPSHVHAHHGRKYAQCPRCQTKVCTLCNAKMHKSKDCPKDPEILKLVAQAKEKGWQSCYSCHAMVELKEGCNHMTCRCTAEFCMVCGLKWKTCDCPWFNENQLQHPDRLLDWRIPEPVQEIYRRAFGDRPPEQRAAGAPPARPREQNAPRGHATYREEMEQRRRQERLDADLARRLQLASLLEPEEEPRADGDRRRPEMETWGLGNAAGHFMNENFVHNAANVVMSAFGDAAVGTRGERSSTRRRRPPRDSTGP